MLVSDRLKLIFIHVPRTGGRSITQALHGTTDDIRTVGRWHSAAMTGKTQLYWYNYRSFAFVRNPWDRMVSAYSYFVRDGQSFEDFLRSRRWPEAMQPQTSWLNDFDGTCLVDVVGRYENLAADFAVACPQAPPLERLNGSVHGAYQDYYTNTTRDLVAEMFAADLAAFGYVWTEDT